MKLDLACGQRKELGYEGVDIAALPGVDHVVDLEMFPWPFDDNVVEAIHCSHYVEHTYDLMAFMDEIWRICAPGALIKIIHPYYTSIRAFQDPTHRRFLGEQSWAYFDANWRKREGLDHYPLVCHYDVVEFGYSVNNDFAGLPPDELRQAITHQWNVVDDLHITLRVVKDDSPVDWPPSPSQEVDGGH